MRTVVGVLALFVLEVSMIGQTNPDERSSIAGVVTVRTGAAIPNTPITILAASDSHTVATGQTDSTGRFSFFIAPGDYKLRFAPNGFVPKTLSATVEVGQQHQMAEVVLEVGSLVDPIQVEAYEPPITPTPLIPLERSAPTDTTVCQLLKTPEVFNGHIVRFRAAIVTGPYTIALKDQHCERTIWLSIDEDQPSLAQEFAFVSGPTILRSPYRLDWMPLPPPRPIVVRKDNAYRELGKSLATQVQSLICEHCSFFAATATVTGRFDYSDGKTIALRETRSGKVEQGVFRYGYLKYWDSQLVLQSVSDVVAKPVDPQVSVPQPVK